jgi:hypothetical protein
MLNPYRRSGSSGGGNERENENGSNGNDNYTEINNKVVTNPSIMGGQSQRRMGSVKKSLKNGSGKNKTRSKTQKKKSGLLQLGVDGRQAFVPERDCIVCRGHHLNRMGQCVSISHKPHDSRCARNTSTRGSSSRTVEVNKFVKDMVAINTMPLSLGQTKGLPSVSQHFKTTTTTTTRMAGVTTTTTTTTGDDEGDKQEGNY